MSKKESMVVKTAFTIGQFMARHSGKMLDAAGGNYDLLAALSAEAARIFVDRLCRGSRPPVAEIPPDVYDAVISYEDTIRFAVEETTAWPPHEDLTEFAGHAIDRIVGVDCGS